MTKMMILERKIYLADTDATGFVYYARYLEWMEAARIELLESLGFSVATFMEADILPVVREASCKYAVPIRLGDDVRVACTARVSSKLAIDIDYEFTRPSDESDGGTGTVQVVFLDRTSGRPIRIPGDLIAALS